MFNWSFDFWNKNIFNANGSSVSFSNFDCRVYDDELNQTVQVQVQLFRLNWHSSFSLTTAMLLFILTCELIHLVQGDFFLHHYNYTFNPKYLDVNFTMNPEPDTRNISYSLSLFSKFQSPSYLSEFSYIDGKVFTLLFFSICRVSGSEQRSFEGLWPIVIQNSIQHVLKGRKIWKWFSQTFHMAFYSWIGPKVFPMSSA